MAITKPKVKCLSCGPLGIIIVAARRCTDSMDKSDSGTSSRTIGPKDRKLIKGTILKSNGTLDPPHESVLEHLTFTFDIQDVSRALLQEIARHRMASFSVKSTRYTLNKIKSMNGGQLAEQLVTTGVAPVDLANFEQLRKVQQLRMDGLSNDKVKYLLPEAFKTSMVMTINARSLRNMFVLRTSARALPEFRNMMLALYTSLPVSYMFLFEDRIHVIEPSK